MDDLNKTLPISNTSPSLVGSGNASSASSSSSVGSAAATSSSNSGSSTSTPLSSAHEADSLDKILADLESQLKAKQNEAAGGVKNIKTESVKSVSETTSSPLVVKAPAEIVVEEKHELMNVKSDMGGNAKVDAVPSTKPTPSTSESLKPTTSSEHAFAMSSGIAAAQKKVVPETVGAVSVMGISSMKKDTAVPTPPSMPGIGNMAVGGASAPIKPKKRNRTGVILGIALLVFTVLGTGAAMMLNFQPGGVFDYRRYAADNMCNVNPGSCQTEQDWINGWFEARQPENQNATPKQDEMTNANDNQNPDGSGPKQEIIRHAGEAGVGDPGKGNRTGDQTPGAATNAVPQPGTTTSICSATEKSGCGGANQGYCVCGGGKVCDTGFYPLGGDCVPLTTKENTTGKPGEVNTHCQSNSGCASGLVCSDHTCSLPQPTPTTASTTSQYPGSKAGDIPIPGTGGKLVMRDGKIVVLDFVPGQTIGNTCDLPDSKCDTYDKWVEGYYKARKPESFGLVAPAGKPIYTDILTDLDPTTDKTQVGTIKYNPTTKEWYIDGIATLNLDSKLSDDAKKSQSNNGGVSVSSLATTYTIKDGKLSYAGQTLTGAAAGIPKGWELAVGKSCASGALKCGDSSKGTGFCVPLSEQDGKTTCDGYFSRFGIAIRYQAFGTDKTPNGSKITAAYIAQFCGTAEDTTPVTSSLGSYKVITCNGSPEYTQCVDHLNGTFMCYLREKNGIAGSAIPETAGFKLTGSGDCLETNGNDSQTQLNAYHCDPKVSGGCQDNGSSFSGKMCLSSVISTLASQGITCGQTIQIDADDTSGNHYSINQWLPACGTPYIPGTPIIVPGPPPTDTPPCTNCGGPEPTPSPPPPGSPVCVDITSSISAPRLGDAPTFTCLPAALATRYEFRSRIGTGAYSTLAPASANSNVSSPLTVNASGVYTIQCRPCNANGCANWDNL